MTSTSLTLLTKDVSIKKMALSTAALGGAMMFGILIGSMPALTQSNTRVSMAALANVPPTNVDEPQNMETQARQAALRNLAQAMNRAPIPAPVAAPAKASEEPVKMEPQDMQKLAGKAAEAIRLGDIASARLVLEHAVRAGDATALYALAETYDPRVLVKLRVQGMQGEPETARQLYQQALDRGVEEARSRL